MTSDELEFTDEKHLDEFLCTTMQDWRNEISNRILGKNFEEMQAECVASGWILRPTRIDGNRMIGTADYKPNRINVEVDDGIITKV